MIINVIDDRSPGQDIQIARRREAHPVDVQRFTTPDGLTLDMPSRVINDQLIVVSRGMSMTRIVRQIIETIRDAGGGRRLWLLRLIGHGNSGWMQLGSGLDSRTASPFQQLRPYFNRVNDDRQGLELHGCAVAAAGQISEGECGAVPTNLHRNNLLQRLADLTGVPVRAGVCRQYPDFDMRIEDAVVTAQPRSRVRSR